MTKKRLLGRIDLLLRLGTSVTEAGRILGSSKTRIHRLAEQHGSRRRRRSLSAKRVLRLRELLDAAEMSRAEIAATMRIDVCTVREYEQRFLDELGPLKVRPLRNPVRCACGNLVKVSPCVICAARSQREIP